MQDPFQGINATAEGPADGLRKLKELISDHIYGLSIPQTYKHTVRNQTLQWIDAWKWYQDKENKVVEVWAQFWLYRLDGQLQWHIKVLWDADSPDSKNSQPHYGYEIYLNGHRMAGPGHVNFTKVPPLYVRDGNKMHEVHKGVEASQVWDVSDNPQFRLDCALRLWSCGTDIELDQASQSDQEYYQLLWRPPAGWQRFARPSFGQAI
ncbi:Nn.00g080350.m01.CDS01 [Neocucurbitaria sp. VM-36]